ncbi:hypothetical protein [Corynebacterium efficiens YS-314]|uniref:Uncharacterized protein n=1 Tax=Corynebacterium efficiens (strain DSM 44549 / YS-314 / AJ 12310 / JCM 11189 / NBRC 100395) TaxID=196164 RepID=Q8FTY2_COREF|nr:hypothetical protein [Corynebacterium efficiens YS-314]
MVLVKLCPQWVHRHLVVPLVVVPFFLVRLLHMGQRGRLVVTHSYPTEGGYQIRGVGWGKAVGIAVGELLTVNLGAVAWG